VIISIPLRSASPLFSLVPLGSNLTALFVLLIILTLASFITVVEHAVLVMAEIDLSAWRRMQGTCAIIALPLVTMEAVATLHIDLLLEVEIVLQPLILELLVKVLELPAVDVVHNLLLKYFFISITPY
jgi:hypothetical protein